MKFHFHLVILGLSLLLMPMAISAQNAVDTAESDDSSASTDTEAADSSASTDTEAADSSASTDTGTDTVDSSGTETDSTSETDASEGADTVATDDASASSSDTASSGSTDADSTDDTESAVVVDDTPADPEVGTRVEFTMEGSSGLNAVIYFEQMETGLQMHCEVSTSAGTDAALEWPDEFPVETEETDTSS